MKMNRLRKPPKSSQSGTGKNSAGKARQRRPPAGRILLVEHHESLAAMRCAALRKQGYQVVLTADGLEACRLLERETFDLVVTDARLPSGSGWDVARTAKRSRLPVILTTGWPLPPRIADADYILGKPSSLAHFLALIHHALNNRKPNTPQRAG
jgi:DNA-binding response OmpR family regulator